MSRFEGLLARCCLLSLMMLAGIGDASAADPAASPPRETLRIVALFPMTGPGASLGAFLNEGAVLARENLEKQYQGRLKIDLDVVDSKGRPADAVTGLQAAVARQRPDAVITALSPVSRAVKPVVEQEKILTLVTTTVMKDIARGSDQMVRVYTNADDFAAPIAGYAKKHYRKVAVLYVQDEFGESLFAAFSGALGKGRTDIVASNTYGMLQKDTRSLVARTLDAQPEAVYVIGYGPAYINVIRELRTLSPATPLLADNTFSDPAVLAALGDVANGTVFNGVDAELARPTRAGSAAFREAYIARHGRAPYAVSVFAYDALTMIVNAAMTKKGIATPAKPAILRQSPFRGVVGTINIDKDGESSFDMQLMKRDAGQTVLLSRD